MIKKIKKTVVLPLIDGKNHRFVISKITLIVTTYDVDKKIKNTALWTGTGHRFVIALPESEVKKRIYEAQNEKEK